MVPDGAAKKPSSDTGSSGLRIAAAEPEHGRPLDFLQSAITYAVWRGKAIVEDNSYLIE
ncbi:MAG: hypothetical protein ABSF79_03625 [Smithellaceae bacterium]|jgi:hypothetical protein